MWEGRGTHEIIHQPITPHHDHIPLSHFHLKHLRILHWLIPTVRAHLVWEVEGVLHLLGAEDDLTVAYDEETAIA